MAIGLKGLNTKEGNDREMQRMGDSRPSFADYQRTYNLSTPVRREVGAYTPEDFGASVYDNEVKSFQDLNELGDVRAENQPWFLKIANGIGKAGVLAGTTFADGTAGLVVGLATAIQEGRFSGLWDNDFSRSMQSINDWSEEVMPNYYSKAEQESPWYENVFTANFLGDKFIKNLGFSIGALYTGKVAGAPLGRLVASLAKSRGAAQMVASATGAVVSAVNEGRVEALNNTRDWFNLQKRQLADRMVERLDAKGVGYSVNDNGDLIIDQSSPGGVKEASIYNSTLEKLTEDRLKMGNMDLLMNIPILTFSNIVQFGRFYSKGFDTGRKVSNSLIRGNKGAALAVTKGALAEGTEEISQKAASVVSGKYYESDVDSYFKSRIDPNAEKEAIGFIQANMEGIAETLGDPNSWEEFTIGALTGVLGIPTFRSARTEEGKWRSPIALEGGAVQHWKDHMSKVKRAEEIDTYVNNRIQSPEYLNYYQGLISHIKRDNEKEDFLRSGDKFNYLNAEHRQLVEDIIMFDNAGRLEELKDMINSAFDTSDENLHSIVKNTTKEIDGKLIGPFAEFAVKNPDGTIEASLDNGGREAITESLRDKADRVQTEINNYRKVKDKLDESTNGVFTDSQLGELAWMQSHIDNWESRLGSMGTVLRDTLLDIRSKIEDKRNLADREREESLMREGASQEEIEGSVKRVSNYENYIKSIDTILSVPRERLGNMLSNNKQFTESLFANTLVLGSDIISGLDKNNVLTLLDDVIRIGDAQAVYREKLEEYLNNPESLTASNDRAREEVSDNIRAEEIRTLEEQLENAQSIAEIRNLAEGSNKDNIDAVIQKWQDGTDDTLKRKATNYKETTQYDSELKKALNELGETDQVSQDAMTLWQEQFNTAENLEQLANPNSIYINNEDAFLEDSESDVDLAGNRFQNARYALQRAMSKVNNDIRFKNRFSEEYRKPVDEPVTNKGIDKDETGDSGTSTVPHVNPNATPVETPSVPIGNVTAEMVAAENSDANRRVETQRSLDQSQQGQRKYYRPAVPELHIEASKEGDFRPFDVVVAEREPNVDFSGIYSYLRDNGAFNYVNAAKIKTGDTLGFMIDPDFNDHTIFLVDTRNNQIVGSIDESDASVARYAGLEDLIKKVRDEYQASRQSDTVGGSPVALSYLLENGAGTIESAGYFLHGVAAAFPAITNSIEGIRNSIDKETLGMKPDAFVSSNNSSISQIEDLIKEYYGEDGVIIYKELLNNASGFVPAEGAKIEARLEKLVPIKETPTTRNTGRFFATPQTRVSKMMVGRIPYTSEDRSLADIPGVLDGDTKPVFGIIKNGTLTTNEKIDDRLIIKPVDMSQKEGRLYLLIPNAAGTYSPAAVRVKHFNNQEFNLDDAAVANTPIGRSINEAIEKLSDATSQDDVSIAMKELAQDLYMQDVLVTWFEAKAGSGIVISRKVRKPDGTYEMVNINGHEQIKENKYTIYYQNSKRAVTINGLEYTYEAAQEAGADMSLFGQPRDAADIRRDILNTLLRFNLPLQVSVSKVNDSGYNNRVIKSNVLTSNLREAKVIGSWFTTDYFDKQGNLQRAISPSSVKPAPGRRTTTPVGGTEGVIQGTPVRVGNSTYTVDLKTMVYTDSKGAKYAATTSNAHIFDMAWAQENFGDSTESSVMTENKVITPQGRVLDRNTGTYVSDAEAKRIKDKIAGRNQATQNRIAESKRVIADIYENQKRVDKTRTDSDYYYILEDDGQYYEYSRVHSRLGDNWLGERTETENSRRALEAGTAVDKVVRDFFTSKETPVKPENLSESAFIDLISNLTEIKSKMEQMGETFMVDNIVLFQKYADGTRVAGEVDILSVDKNGNFKIYDVKTSRYSFEHRYFTEKSSKQRMSTKDYYTLQLSAYQNLFESQYGVKPIKLAILPFVVTYETITNKVELPSGKRSNLGLPIKTNTKGYFNIGKHTSEKDARFEMVSMPNNKVMFAPVMKSAAHKNTMRGTDAYRTAIDFIGGDIRNAIDFILVEPGEADRSTTDVRLNITKKAKVFVVTPSTPYTSQTSNIVSKIEQQKGIPVTYNSAVPVPLASAIQTPQQQNALPIFDPTIETMITEPKEQNRILPENAFEEGGEIGYYEKDGKLYNGYLKKVGEIEVTHGSGKKDMVPIHLTKVRDRGFGREGEFGPTSEYLTVFPNGMAISTRTNDTNDDHATKIIMEALSKNPAKVQSLASEKTQISDGFEKKEESPVQPSNAATTVQREDAINNHDEEFEDDLDLGELRKVDDSSRELWNKEKELTWLKGVLPQLSEQDRVRVVKGLIRVANQGAVAWGSYQNGIITLSDVAAEGTTYHEAFHAVFDLLLSEDEKAALLNEAREKWGDLAEQDLKEELAEAFREYVASRGDRSLGRKILDFFKELFAKVTNFKFMKPSMTAYFQVINQGRYSRETLGKSSQGEAEYRKKRVIADTRLNSAIRDSHIRGFVNGTGDSRMTKDGHGYYDTGSEVIEFHFDNDRNVIIDYVSIDERGAKSIKDSIEYEKRLEDSNRENLDSLTQQAIDKAYPNGKWNSISLEEREQFLECKGL